MSARRGIRVLVVDDEPAVRALHGRYVSEAPGFVLAGAADSGESALAWVRRGGIDLILLDMQLGGISGVEVLHRMHRELAHPPSVLVISSARDHITVRQALSARVVGYLVKPFTRATLHDRLRVFRTGFRETPDDAHDRPLAQGEIDRMLGPGRGSAPAAGSGAEDPPSATAQPPRLPKGLAAPTLQRVVDALDPITATSVAELADRTEMSRPTARRYLEFLVSQGAVDVAHRYGRRGRPEVLYRLAAGR